MSINQIAGTTRRQFLQTGLGVAGGFACTTVFPRVLAASGGIYPGSAPGIQESEVKTLAERALDAARSAGAVYADVRLTRTRRLYVAPGKPMIWENLHCGVRTLVDGYWGFAASPVWQAGEMARLGKEAVRQAKANTLGKARDVTLAPVHAVASGHWDMPVKYDTERGVHPLEMADFLSGLQAWAAVEFGSQSGFDGKIKCFVSDVQEKAFASTGGSYCTQRLHASEGRIEFRGEKGAGMVEGLSVAGVGWELFRDRDLREAMKETAEYNRRMSRLPLKPLDVGKYDVILDAATVAELLGKTIGAATEIDRAYGYEANAGGTSYLADPSEVLGSFVLASPLVTVTANRDDVGGVATTRWDDEGITPERVTLVDKGIVVDYQTSREGAGWLQDEYKRLGRPLRSHGNMFAPTGIDVPLIHTANLRLQPDSDPSLTADEMERSMAKGILFTSGNVDTDFQGIGGLIFPQVSGGAFEIKAGKRVARLNGCAIQFRTPELWKNIIKIAGPSAVRAFGTGGGLNDVYDNERNAYKGEPRQVVRHTATAVPISAKEMSVINRYAR